MEKHFSISSQLHFSLPAFHPFHASQARSFDITYLVLIQRTLFQSVGYL